MKSKLDIYIGMPKLLNAINPNKNIMIIDPDIKDIDKLNKDIRFNNFLKIKNLYIFKDYIDLDNEKNLYFKFNENKFNGPEKDIYLFNYKNLLLLEESIKQSKSLESFFNQREIKLEEYSEVIIFINKGNPVNIIKGLGSISLIISKIFINVPSFDSIWMDKLDNIFRNLSYINTSPKKNLWEIDQNLQRLNNFELHKKHKLLLKDYELLSKKLNCINEELEKLL